MENYIFNPIMHLSLTCDGCGAFDVAEIMIARDFMVNKNQLIQWLILMLLQILQDLQYHAAMTNEQFKAGRLQAGLTQMQASQRLKLSQPYLSQLERGQRPITSELARLVTSVFRLSPTALPVPETAMSAGVSSASKLARQLAGLGYPGFAHLRGERTNPGALMLQSLVQRDLEVRVTEALPWVLGTFPDLNWPWLMDQVKLNDAQNRLGFLVGMTKELGESKRKFRAALEPLSAAEVKLEQSRLAREDTLCRESMLAAERRWLALNRSALARHWNLLTGLSADQLSYAA
jgi:transcriptional regulator with XRE-family HTH domain